SHRDGRGAPPARRDDREYREYLSEEQRSPWGCIARRMQPDFHHGLPAHVYFFISASHSRHNSAVLIDMRRELAAILSSDTRAADVIVGGASWRVHIFGIAVIGGDAFVQVALVGPVTSTATVRIEGRVVVDG